METLVQIARRRAVEQPHEVAFVFLADGSVEATRLTWSELDRAGREIAARLLEVTSPGERVLLVYETGLDFVTALLGCMYAGIVSAPIPAPEASRLKGSYSRIDAVAADCDARLLLGNARTHELLREGRREFRTIEEHCWIDTAQWVRGREEYPPEVDLDPASTAYLQYTSGSTGAPRGVMVTWASLDANLSSIQRGLDYNSSSVSVIWMPHFHDYGLVEGILIAIYNGHPCYLISPFSFLKRPVCWLEAISKYRGTHTQAPNFAYRYCARRVTAEQKKSLDLSSWRSAGNAAEPIHPETSREFHVAFSSCGLRWETLRPAYGLAEATLLVTAMPMSEGPVTGNFSATALARGRVLALPEGVAAGQRVVDCGAPLPDTEIAIVDPETLVRVAPNAVGEVWVCSPGVAGGYFQRPEETEATFRGRIAGEESTGQTWLRTGDLGFLYRGHLYINARAKDLIIIRGLNHYPSDIEWTAQHSHAALRHDHGASFSIEAGGEERLCLVQELERGDYSEPELDRILEGIAQAVAEYHGIPLYAAVLIRRGSLLKTTSGKVQRQACRQAFLDGSLKQVRCWHSPAARPVERKEPPQPRKADRLIEWLRDYAETRINSRLIDERRCIPPPVIMDLGNAGVFGLQVPEQYGGLALSNADTFRIYQQLGAIDLSLATLVFLHNTNGIRPILGFGSLELQQQLLPLLASGRQLAGFCLSEPDAGSNLGAVAATAVPDGDGTWRLDGVKRWNGTAWTGVMSVFVRTADERGRLRGFTGFVLRQGEPGVRIGPESLTMGMRGIMQNSLFLRGVRVRRDQALGEPGRGMQVVEYVLGHGRLATSAVCLGAMQRCAQLMHRYASRRPIDTGLLLDNPQTLSTFTSLLHRIELLRSLLLYSAEQLDNGGQVVTDVSMALKVMTTESLNDAADALMQLLGGRGYMENNIAPQILRDARALSVGEGANEALVAAIGRGVRLNQSCQEFLGELTGCTDLGSDLNQCAAADPSVPLAWARSGVVWRDVLLGRVACSALLLGAARRSGDSSSMEWAQAQFEVRKAELVHGTVRGALDGRDVEARVAELKDFIGDLESRAPDVDYELDPLLRREWAPAATAPDATAPDAEAALKREQLRKLLLARAAGAGVQG